MVRVLRGARSWSALPGLADQALASGVNFLTLIVLGRSLSPSRFGYFVLAFTLLQSAGAVQSALITRPHNVLGALRTGTAYVRYTTAAATLQLGYAAVWALALALAGGVLAALGGASSTLFLLAAPAVVAWQLQEFGRRVLYTEGRLYGALLDDVLGYGAQAAILVWLWRGDALTGPRAMAAIAATSAVAALVAGFQLRSSLGRTIDRESLRTGWGYGRWLAAAELAYWFSSQSYIYLASAVVGPVASAILKAAQTLLGPASVFLAFFVNFLPTRFASRLRVGGDRALARQVRVGLLSTLPATVAYAVAVAVFAGPLLEFVYGSAYAGHASVVRLFAAYYVLLSISDVFVAALAARALTRRIFAGHAAGAVLSLVLGWVLLYTWGAAGGAAGMIASLVVALAVFVRSYRAAAARPLQAPAQPPAPAAGVGAPPSR
ncbi:MAG TPA: hypothetical protein VFI37_10110 [Gaiellaceae bacterium]|nr:hypothetical protein [Gaiellaceae bacterium]